MSNVISGGRMKDYRGYDLWNPSGMLKGEPIGILAGVRIAGYWPPHHNARPPKKVRKHERRKYINWWKRIAKHCDCKPWDDLCTHRPNQYPEPDGA